MLQTLDLNKLHKTTHRLYSKMGSEWVNKRASMQKRTYVILVQIRVLIQILRTNANSNNNIIITLHDVVSVWKMLETLLDFKC